jgi:formylmethanofuran dehydrogenase subunit E
MKDNKDSTQELRTVMESAGLSPRLREYMEKCAEFHTYPAPGLLIGVFMVDYALEKLSANPGERLYAVVETRKCAPDPLQVITHCTIGNNRLKVLPIGKFALTLNRQSNDPEVRGVRVYVDSRKLKAYPVIYSWFSNEPKEKQAAGKDRLLEDIIRAGRNILSAEEVILGVTDKKAWTSSVCSKCGEMVPSDSLENGLCPGCGSLSYYRKPVPPIL